jgi:hypothetical protein
MHPSRIHAALDGDLPRCLLDEEEEAAAARLECAATLAAEALRSAPVPALSARVLAALPQEAPAAPIGARAIAALVAMLERGLGWAWQPRTLVLRPAWGMAAALGVLLLVAVPRGAPVDSAPAAVYVQFRLEAPAAEQVSLAGSFTGWEPRLELHPTAAGVWTLTVPLEAGMHDYLFVVDGEEWLPDPAGYPVDDGFGGTNSRIFLAVPRSAT